MAKRRITKRWLFNSFGIILLILIAIEILSAYGFKSYYYSGVRQTVASRADLVEGLLKKYAQYESADYTTEVRGLIENFEDKDKMEIMALNVDGGILLSSSGFEATRTLYMPDFQQALESENGEGYFQGTLYGEKILALTRIFQVSDEEIFAIRYVTSLARVDQQIISLVAIITVFGMAIIFFVVLSSSYFINSIVVPLGKVGQTARKIAQGDFSIRLEKENDDEIGELCEVINYMAGELSKAEQLKNDFISSVSHELRTPLTAIKGWAETLSGEEKPDRETMQKGMAVIGKETERLSGMVEELLDFSRIQSGRMAMVMDRMDLVAELDDAVLMFGQRAAREKISLLYEEPEELIVVIGDHNRLKQVFVNILDNALKHTAAGGEIAVHVQHTGEAASVVIADTGEGIKPEDLPQVKTKFYKGDSTKRGSGIGLAVADEIVNRHGGSLEIESFDQKGTTDTIILPLAGKRMEAEITEAER